MMLEAHQCEAGARGVAALVPSVNASPFPSLFPAFTSENARPDGDAVLDSKLMQARRRIPGNDFIMGCLASDDAAKRDAAAMTPSAADETVGKRKAERQGNFERTRHRNSLKIDLTAAQFVDRAAGQFVGDVFVEPCLDDED